MSQPMHNFFPGVFPGNRRFAEPRIDEVHYRSGVRSWREPGDARWAPLMAASVLAVWAMVLVMASLMR